MFKKIPVLVHTLQNKSYVIIKIEIIVQHKYDSIRFIV